MINRFSQGVIIRVLLLVILIASAVGSLLVYEFYITSSLLVAIVFLQCIEFIRFASRTDKKIRDFFHAVKHNDFTPTPKEVNSGIYSQALDDELNAIKARFAANKLEKENHYHLLKLILDEMPSGVLILEEEESVYGTNKAFHELFDIPSVPNISRMDEYVSGIQGTLADIEKGRRSIALQTHGEQEEVLVEFIEITQTKSRLKVYLFNAVSEPLKEKEMQAYTKLVRILTHEIMNAVTSISSLSSTSLEILDSAHSDPSVQKAVSAIHRRSKGLLDFVERYRKFTDVPAPEKQWINIHTCISKATESLKAELEGIKLSISGDKAHNVLADDGQLDSVLTNVLLNAIHALKTSETKEIQISWEERGKFKYVFIEDSGVGISQERMQEVFVPFFTTREEGSGIGLPLARQIMQKHGGGIYIESEPGEFTRVALRISNY